MMFTQNISWKFGMSTESVSPSQIQFVMHCSKANMHISSGEELRRKILWRGTNGIYVNIAANLGLIICTDSIFVLQKMACKSSSTIHSQDRKAQQSHATVWLQFSHFANQIIFLHSGIARPVMLSYTYATNTKSNSNLAEGVDIGQLDIGHNPSSG